MRRIKNAATAGALVGAAIIGGTVISSTFASSNPAGSGTISTLVAPAAGVDQAYLDAYLDTLASELGVARSALGPAAVAAASAAIDAAVAGGDLAADDAEALKERLAGLEDPERLLVGRGVPGHGPGGRGEHGRHVVGPGLREAADAAAEAIGIERDALVQAFRDGSSLEEIASDHGVAYDTVKTAVTDAVKARLDDEVSDEDLTRQRADAILERLADWLDDGGEAPAFGREPRGGFGLGG